MGVSESYGAFLEDLFADFGEVKIRAMFGGAGVYHDGIMFALVAGETLYFKADSSNRPDFEGEGMVPFIYEANGKTATMSYWKLPERLYDDPEDLAVWARRAFEAAQRAKQGFRK